MTPSFTLDIDLHAENILRACLGFPDGVDRWNDLMGGLDVSGLVGKVWDDDVDEPFVVMGLLMAGVDLSGLSMPSINLSPIFMERCILDSCDLRGTTLAMCRGCSFHGADVRGTTFAHFSDLTDADFTGTNTDDSTVIELALYDEGHPPKGLPGRLLAKCHAVPPEERNSLMRTKVVPVGVAARLIIL
jgi:hypothetical protein